MGKTSRQLLGVPVADNGTGLVVSKVVLEAVNDAKIKDSIIGLSFDTTAANTGAAQGAVGRVERGLGRSVLWLACRHHVYELVLKHVFEECLGASSVPSVVLFKRFHDRWPSIDQGQYQTLESDEVWKGMAESNEWCDDQRTKMLTAYDEILRTGRHPREDYKELIQLCYVFLGGQLDGLVFRAPGAFHQARWMAKAIYCIKMALFMRQASLTERKANGIRRVAVFVALLYAKFWHEAVVARWAGKNDLDFLEALRIYPDRPTAALAMKALQRHLWYISEELIGLAFFDERIEPDVKREMASNLTATEAKNSLKRVDGKAFTSDKSIQKYVTSNTQNFFQLVSGSRIPDFIAEDPDNWESHEEFQRARLVVNAIRAVNDTAERGIGLMKRFNSTITKDEAQKQFLLKVVRHHTSLVKSKTKSEAEEKSLLSGAQTDEGAIARQR